MEPQSARPRILFVDDEPAILRGIRNAFRRDALNWDLAFVTSARDAIEELERVDVQVVVSDARMADLDGAAVLEAAAVRRPGARRIVLTGQADASALDRLRGVAHEILLKPCSSQDLRAAIHRALGG